MIKWLVRLFQSIENKEKHYVSDADKFLKHYDQVHPTLSVAQMKEVEKHRGIFNKKTDSRIRW